MGPPLIDTRRLILRPIETGDLEPIYKYARDPDHTRYMGWKTHQSPEDTKKFIDSVLQLYKIGEYYDWAITLKLSSQLIGTCGLSNLNRQKSFAEAGYIIDPDHLHQGYGFEALSAMIDFVFSTLKLNRLYARIFKENQASITLAEKAGFIHTPTPDDPIEKNHICRGADSWVIDQKRYKEFVISK